MDEVRVKSVGMEVDVAREEQLERMLHKLLELMVGEES